MIEVSLVPRQGLPDIWDEAAPHLEEAVKHADGRASMADTLLNCLKGFETLWVAFDGNDVIGALTVTVTEYPGMKLLTGNLLGGKRFDEWAPPMIDALRAFGQEMGTSGLEYGGRDGWVRMMKKFGFKQTMVVVKMDW